MEEICDVAWWDDNAQSYECRNKRTHHIDGGKCRIMFCSSCYGSGSLYDIDQDAQEAGLAAEYGEAPSYGTESYDTGLAYTAAGDTHATPVHAHSRGPHKVREKKVGSTDERPRPLHKKKRKARKSKFEEFRDENGRIDVNNKEYNARKAKEWRANLSPEKLEALKAKDREKSRRAALKKKEKKENEKKEKK